MEPKYRTNAMSLTSRMR